MAGRTLHLTIPRKDFEVIAMGEKRLLFLSPVSALQKRLANNDFQYVCLLSGHGKQSPTIMAEFKHWVKREDVHGNGVVKYSTGLACDVFVGDLVIEIGDIIKLQNYFQDERFSKKNRNIRKNLALKPNGNGVNSRNKSAY